MVYEITVAREKYELKKKKTKQKNLRRSKDDLILNEFRKKTRTRDLKIGLQAQFERGRISPS